MQYLFMRYHQSEVIQMGEKFIGKRITELRLMRNVSEYQMSLELGQSKSYVQGITSGKSLPSIKQLYNIADYFNMSLAEFFDESKMDSPLLCEVRHEAQKLSDDDLMALLNIIRRMSSYVPD